MRKWLWHFHKNYSLIPFDAFNGSLVEHVSCDPQKIILELFEQGYSTRRAKSSKETWQGSPIWPVTGTGLTGAWRRVTWRLFAGWPSSSLYHDGWPSLRRRVTWPEAVEKYFWWSSVNGNEMLDTFKLINHLCVMTKYVNEPLHVLNWIMCYVWEIQISLALIKGNSLQYLCHLWD